MIGDRLSVAGYFRIVFAITLKDVADSLKNKSILTVLFAATLLMVMYKAMPVITSADDPPSLALYDAGNSGLVAELESDSSIDFHKMASTEEMERYLGKRNMPVLGLVLPPGFDGAVASGEPIELKGYVDHWVSESAAGETGSFFERQLASFVGAPVRIHVARETVFTQPDGWQPYNLALAMVVLLTMFGLSITPNLLFEEKQTRTLDALLISPATAGQVVVSKGITSLIYCLMAAVIVLAVNATLIVHWEVAMLAFVSGSLFAIALGLLLGSILESRQQISAITLILFQPLLLPVGLSVITDLFPERVNAIIAWIPTVAVAQLFRLSTQAGAPISRYAPELAYVCICAGLILLAVAWKVRRSNPS